MTTPAAPRLATPLHLASQHWGPLPPTTRLWTRIRPPFRTGHTIYTPAVATDGAMAVRVDALYAAARSRVLPLCSAPEEVPETMRGVLWRAWDEAGMLSSGPHWQPTHVLGGPSAWGCQHSQPVVIQATSARRAPEYGLDLGRYRWLLKHLRGVASIRQAGKYFTFLGPRDALLAFAMPVNLQGAGGVEIQEASPEAEK